MADEPKVELPDPITKTALLAALRAQETKLYSSAAVAKIQQQPKAQQIAFVQARLHLTAKIAQLNSALMRDIGDQLEAQRASLEEGIDRLAKSLDDLDQTGAWIKAVNGVISLLTKVLPLF